MTDQHDHDEDPVPISLAVNRWKRLFSDRHWSGPYAGHHELCAITYTDVHECDLECTSDADGLERAIDLEALHRARAGHLFDTAEIPDAVVRRSSFYGLARMQLAVAVGFAPMLRAAERIARAFRSPR